MFPLLVVAMIAAVAYSIAFLLSGNHLKAAAGSCIFLFFFWFFDAVAGFLPPGQTTAEAALAVVMLGIGLILFFAVKRIKKTQNLLSLIYILLIPIALLVGFNLAVIINAEHKKTTTAGLTRTVTVIPEGQERDYPDIYILFFDEFASLESMEKLWNYDNSAFARKLEEKGFHIARNSRTRYAMTHMAIPGVLNLKYLDPDISRAESYRKYNRNLVLTLI